MKRFEHCKVLNRMISAPDGEWVEADIAEELYEVVSELSCYKDSPVPNTLIDLAEKVKKKAKGEYEMEEHVINTEREEGVCMALGWMYAEACNLVDKGIDIRKEDCGQYIKRAIKDLAEEGEGE